MVELKQDEIDIGFNVELTASGALLMGDVRKRERDTERQRFWRGNISGLITSFPGPVNEQNMMPRVRSIALK